MAIAVTRENYTLHKLHSLTGVVPVGYYLVQHLALNTFSLAGPAAFNGVIDFFKAIPAHLLLLLEIFVILIPLIFHAVYGLFIISRSLPNIGVANLRYRENFYYTFQRISGILAFLFLCYHVFSTTMQVKITGNYDLIMYEAWAAKLMSFNGLILAVYVVGITTSSYHFAYGLWSFCIRWGITISDAAQGRLWKASAGIFALLTLMGFGALFGFLNPVFKSKEEKKETVTYSVPAAKQVATR